MIPGPIREDKGEGSGGVSCFPPGVTALVGRGNGQKVH